MALGKLSSLVEYSSLAAPSTARSFSKDHAVLRQHGIVLFGIMESWLGAIDPVLWAECKKAACLFQREERLSFRQALCSVDPALPRRISASLSQAGETLFKLAQEPNSIIFCDDLILWLRNFKGLKPVLAQRIYTTLEGMVLPERLKQEVRHQFNLFSGNGTFSHLLTHHLTLVHHELKQPESWVGLAAGSLSFHSTRFAVARLLGSASSSVKLLSSHAAAFALESPIMLGASYAVSNPQNLGPSSFAQVIKESLLPSYVGMGLFRGIGGGTRVGLRSVLGNGEQAILNTWQRAVSQGVSQFSSFGALYSSHYVNQAFGFAASESPFVSSLAEFVKLGVIGSALHSIPLYRGAQQRLDLDATQLIRQGVRRLTQWPRFFSQVEFNRQEWVSSEGVRISFSLGSETSLKDWLWSFQRDVARREVTYPRGGRGPQYIKLKSLEQAWARLLNPCFILGSPFEYLEKVLTLLKQSASLDFNVREHYLLSLFRLANYPYAIKISSNNAVMDFRRRTLNGIREVLEIFPQDRRDTPRLVYALQSFIKAAHYHLNFNFERLSPRQVVLMDPQKRYLYQGRFYQDLHQPLAEAVLKLSSALKMGDREMPKILVKFQHPQFQGSQETPVDFLTYRVLLWPEALAHQVAKGRSTLIEQIALPELAGPHPIWELNESRAEVLLKKIVEVEKYEMHLPKELRNLFYNLRMRGMLEEEAYKLVDAVVAEGGTAYRSVAFAMDKFLSEINSELPSYYLHTLFARILESHKGCLLTGALCEIVKFHRAVDEIFPSTKYGDLSGPKLKLINDLARNVQSNFIFALQELPSTLGYLKREGYEPLAAFKWVETLSSYAREGLAPTLWYLPAAYSALRNGGIPKEYITRDLLQLSQKLGVRTADGFTVFPALLWALSPYQAPRQTFDQILAWADQNPTYFFRKVADAKQEADANNVALVRASEFVH